MPGVIHAHARARWTGRLLRVEVEGWVDSDLTTRDADALGRQVADRVDRGARAVRGTVYILSDPDLAVALARAGATTLITARDEGRGTAAVTDIRSRSGSSDVGLVVFDLASLASVREGAADIKDRCPRIDVLVIDDFLLRPLTADQAADVLEVVEDRAGRRSTLPTSQLPIAMSGFAGGPG